MSAPRIWVTTLRRGGYLKVFTPGSPPGPPPYTTVYIGRASPERAGSPLANPFHLDDEDERRATIARYAEWLRTPDPAALAELYRLLDRSLTPAGGALASS